MSTKSNPSASDVAREAGVSLTTVSHSLSGKGRVDQATRERVVAVAKRLGYAPSHAARTLALGRSDTIGLLLPHLAHMPMPEVLATDWYGRVVVSASQAAAQHGLALTVIPPEAINAGMRRGAIDGIILPDPVTDDSRHAALASFTLPCVTLGIGVMNAYTGAVVPDIAGGMTELLDHLAASGCRRIACLTHDLAWRAQDDAWNAYRDWCTQANMEPLSRTVEAASAPSKKHINDLAYAAALDLLAEPDRPDAVIGMLEDLGPVIVEAAKSLGLQVPDDLLVAQDTDTPTARFAPPSITALDLHPELQTQAAVELLLEMIEDKTPAKTVGSPVTLRARSSTQNQTYRPRRS